MKEEIHCAGCNECLNSGATTGEECVKLRICGCHHKPQEDCQKCGYYICRCEVKPFEPQEDKYFNNIIIDKIVDVKEEEWESRFDKEFVRDTGLMRVVPYSNSELLMADALKDFIRQELLQQKQDLLKEITNMPYSQNDLICTSCKSKDFICREQVLALIKSKK